jgi:hypothetical protein
MNDNSLPLILYNSISKRFSHREDLIAIDVGAGWCEYLLELEDDPRFR